MAGSAFKDKDVVKAMAYFTPILVDGDTEKDQTAKYGAKGYPTTVFADMKGQAVGAPIVGAQPTDAFLKTVQEMSKKIKAGHPSKEATALAAAKAEMDAAVAKKNVAGEMAAILKIEKMNLPGDELDAALAAKKTLLEEGQKRFDAAKELSATDKDGAAKELRKIASEYKGTDLGAEAGKLAKELVPPDAK